MPTTLPRPLTRKLAAAAIATTLGVGPALAHHGWSWTEDGFFKLEGVIADVYVGNPHATLEVDVEGEIWQVDLAPPSRTVAAGFEEGTAEAGDEVTAIGNRSREESERRMKAVRIVIDGTNYDVYPNRVPEE